MKKYLQRLYVPLRNAILITTLVIMQSNLGMMPGQPMQMPGLPSGPNFAPPAPMGGNGGPAGMHMPSDAEIEAMIREMERIAAENPEIIKEWEREGQRAIMAMSDAELNEFGQLMGIDPAQLREEAAKALAGDSPYTEEPAQPTKSKPQETPTDTSPEKPEKPTAKPSKSEINTIKEILRELIDNLAKIQQGASSVREIHEMVRSWSQELRDLMFYLRVIDNDHHYDQLAAPEFKNLLKIITQLQKDLSRELPNIVLPDDLIQESTAYDLLGLQPEASDKEITEAYEKLAKINNPKALEKNLRELGTQESNIKRLVKAARINFEVIEEAYEQLRDEKLRKQLDRTIQAEKKLHKQKLQRALDALTTITASFSQAIYSKQLISELERFLQKYAPQEAALKKKMEAAEKKRAEEQKQQAGKRVQETPGRYEQSVSYGHAPSYDYGYHSDFPSFYGRDWDSHRPDYSYGDKSRDTTSSQPKSPETSSPKPGDKTKEEKAKDEKGGSRDTGEKQAAQQKTAETNTLINNALADIDRQLKEFTKQYGSGTEGTQNKMILRNFETYGKQKPGDIITHEVLGDKQDLDSDLNGLTSEELRATKKLVETTKPGAEKRTVQPIIEPAVLVPDPAPINPIMSKNLETLEKNLKTDKLAETVDNLAKTINKAKPKLTSEQVKSWKKTFESYEKPKKVTVGSATKTYARPLLEEIGKKITDAYASMTPEKQATHKDAVDGFMSTLNSIKENFNNINKKFEE